MRRTTQNGRLCLFVPCEEPPKTVGYAFLIHVKNPPKNIECIEQFAKVPRKRWICCWTMHGSQTSSDTRVSVSFRTDTPIRTAMCNERGNSIANFPHASTFYVKCSLPIHRELSNNKFAGPLGPGRVRSRCTSSS